MNRRAQSKTATDAVRKIDAARHDAERLLQYSDDDARVTTAAQRLGELVRDNWNVVKVIRRRT